MSKSQKYISIIVEISAKDLKDSISNLAMEKYDADGVEEYSLIEKNVDDILGERAYSGGDVPQDVIEEVNDKSVNYEKKLKVFYYKGDFEKRSIGFQEYLNINAIAFEKKVEKWEDWNEEWRAHFKRIDVSDSLSIIPSWEKSKINPNEVYIYPGQGFGTGGHETTFLCLQAFEDFSKNLNEGAHCFDLGCGSGILGIAAIKKKKMFVDFCDVDKAALDNCLQNLELNFEGQNLEGNRLVLRERFEIDKKYQLVFANILENVLVLEKKLILSSLAKGALLLVSGILNHQKQNMINEYADLKLLEEYDRGDWSCLVFKK